MTAQQMNPYGRHRTPAPQLFGLLAGALMIAMTAMTHAASVADLQPKLPTRVSGWQAEGEDRTFDDRTIFGYIDGAGEVYRAYNMRACLSRRFAKDGQTDITLDVFDMGSPEDAFGVFTHDTDGERVDIGQDARYRPGWLSFWQNRFFVSIYLDEESAAAELAVKELGKQVAAAAGKPGKRPSILGLLPAAGLEAGAIRFLHHPIVLNYHYYLFDQNILLLSPRTDAALASYRRGGEQARLLLISYPQARTAREALAGFRRHYLPDAGSSGFARLENGKWSAARQRDRMLTIVLEADSRRFAENLLMEAERNASGE
ncbi:MAG: hypothetical protein AMJ54_14085 [Deltaproteobacteria bacterium SG8_13]|nr:MAG: hypothetical protein AMJ54_14085 [Deltaproteobacteria bacterium SG8_13]